MRRRTRRMARRKVSHLGEKSGVDHQSGTGGGSYRAGSGCKDDGGRGSSDTFSSGASARCSGFAKTAGRRRRRLIPCKPSYQQEWQAGISGGQERGGGSVDELNPDQDDSLDAREAGSVLQGVLQGSVFRRADTDGDGTVSKAEYLAYVERMFELATQIRTVVWTERSWTPRLDGRY